MLTTLDDDRLTTELGHAFAANAAAFVAEPDARDWAEQARSARRRHRQRLACSAFGTAALAAATVVTVAVPHGSARPATVSTATTTTVKAPVTASGGGFGQAVTSSARPAATLQRFNLAGYAVTAAVPTGYRVGSDCQLGLTQITFDPQPPTLKVHWPDQNDGLNKAGCLAAVIFSGAVIVDVNTASVHDVTAGGRRIQISTRGDYRLATTVLTLDTAVTGQKQATGAWQGSKTVTVLAAGNGLDETQLIDFLTSFTMPKTTGTAPTGTGPLG